MAQAAHASKIVPVNRNNAPSSADLIFLVIAPVTAILRSVKLTQSDGDLAAHIRMGETILSTHMIPVHSLASYTAAADPMVAQAWLSEVLFAGLWRLGGLPLLAAFTAIVIAATHASVALFLRNRGADPRWAVIAALVSLAVSSTHWLTRPHMFSIVGVLLTVYLLESGRGRKWIFFIPLYGLWANLHGGWLYGLAVIGVYITGQLLETVVSKADRHTWIQSARQNAAALCAATFATLLTPFGYRLHLEVLGTATNSDVTRHMAEFLPPDFQGAAAFPFVIAIVLSIVIFALNTQRMQYPWMAAVVLGFLGSVRSFRNIALFGVSAWPLIALHASRTWPRGKRHVPLFTEFARLDPNSRTGIIAGPVALLLLILGLNRGHVGGTTLIPDRFSSRVFPVAAVDSARAASLDGRVFESWRWGGYIMQFWPEASVHVDPLKFNARTMRSYGLIDEMRPGWQDELRRWEVRTIIVDATTPLAKGLLHERSWKVWYRDSTAVVFRPTVDPVI